MYVMAKEEATEFFKLQCAKFRKMAPEEREAYRQQKLQELRMINTGILRSNKRRNEIINEIVASMPDVVG